MIDLVTPITLIDALAPGPIDVALPEVPELAPALQLARTIGADPTTVATLHSVVSVGLKRIAKIVSQARPYLVSAVNDLFGIGARFLQQAIRIVPGLFVPIPGARAKALVELAALTFDSVRQAERRVADLARELAPLVLQLNKVGTERVAELPAAVPEPAMSSPHGNPPVASSTGSSAGSSAQGEAAVQAALSQLGTPYVWGGTTPGVGFDCSGFTQWAWRQAGVELPRLAQEQTVGRPVAEHELQAGDLVVWDGHVAMYDGSGHIIEAGDPISRNPLRQTNMGMAFKGYYRPTG